MYPYPEWGQGQDVSWSDCWKQLKRFQQKPGFWEDALMACVGLILGSVPVDALLGTFLFVPVSFLLTLLVVIIVCFQELPPDPPTGDDDGGGPPAPKPSSPSPPSNEDRPDDFPSGVNGPSSLGWFSDAVPRHHQDRAIFTMQ